MGDDNAVSNDEGKSWVVSQYSSTPRARVDFVELTSYPSPPQTPQLPPPPNAQSHGPKSPTMSRSFWDELPDAARQILRQLPATWDVDIFELEKYTPGPPLPLPSALMAQPAPYSRF